jgi:endonuclease/exonuclease/phosphatase family metal-dependent hydrolase
VHLSVNSAGERTSELRALQSCASQWPEARVLAGDFNMQASSGEYALATESFVDAWPTARDSGVAVNFDGNCDGCTRNSRIDYIFASRGASSLTLQLAQVFDTRDSNGYMPSDHRPMLVLYAVH